MKSKSVVAILLALCLLVGGVLLWNGLDRRDDPDPDDPGQTAVQPNDGQNGDQNGETESGESGEDGESGESGQSGQDVPDEPEILNDDGDVVIVVPDDQESGGL